MATTPIAWTKIISLGLIIGGFAVMIFFLVRMMRQKCGGSTFMFDKAINICRNKCGKDTDPNCTNCTYWNYANGGCESCPSGQVWHSDIAACKVDCGGNGAWWGGSKENEYKDSKCLCSCKYAGPHCKKWSPYITSTKLPADSPNCNTRVKGCDKKCNPACSPSDCKPSDDNPQ
jgi:hypothetical protein